MTIEINDLIAAHDLVVELARVEGALNSAYEMLQDTLGLRSKTAVDDWIKERKDALRDYITAHGNEAINAGEIGVSAVLRTRGSGAKYDLETLMKTAAGPAALKEAAEKGYVSVNDKLLKTYRQSTPGSSWADALWNARSEHGRSTWVQLDWEAKK